MWVAAITYEETLSKGFAIRNTMYSTNQTGNADKSKNWKQKSVKTEFAGLLWDSDEHRTHRKYYRSGARAYQLVLSI